MRQQSGFFRANPCRLNVAQVGFVVPVDKESMPRDAEDRRIQSPDPNRSALRGCFSFAYEAKWSGRGLRYRKTER